MDRTTLDPDALIVDTYEPESVGSLVLIEDTVTGGCPSSCACCTG